MRRILNQVWATPIEPLVDQVFSDVRHVRPSDYDVNYEHDAIDLCCTNGAKYVLVPEQQCCESVCLVDVAGDLSDLIDTPILWAECVGNHHIGRSSKDIADHIGSYSFGINCLIDEIKHELSYRRDPRSACGTGSDTWTFVRLRTIKGDVTLRWIGSSNGYYSETPFLLMPTDHYGTDAVVPDWVRRDHVRGYGSCWKYDFDPIYKDRLSNL